MALQLIVDSLEAVPAALHGEYAEKDGKFHLNVTGMEDTKGLKSALEKERTAHKAAATAQKELAAKVEKWEKLGKTEEEIGVMLQTVAAAEAEAAKKSGNYDALLADTRAKAADALKQATAAWTAEKLALASERDAARGSERKAVIETSVTGALTKAKATMEGLDLLTERLGKRISFTMEDGERVIQIMQADGKTPMAGSGDAGAATYDDLVKEAVKTYPSLFEGSGTGGTGTGPNARRRDAGGKQMARAEFEKLSPLERAAKMKAGVQLYD